MYYADVKSLQFVGTAFRVEIEAAGRPGMASPLDSCLKVPLDGRIPASNFVSSISLPAEYAGYLEFPASQLIPGIAYSFSYGCAYSYVPLGVLRAR